MRSSLWFHLDIVRLQEIGCLFFSLKLNFLLMWIRREGNWEATFCCDACATAHVFAETQTELLLRTLFCCSCALEEIKLIILVAFQKISPNDFWKWLENLQNIFHYALIQMLNHHKSSVICPGTPSVSLERLTYHKTVNSHYFCEILRLYFGTPPPQHKALNNLCKGLWMPGCKDGPVWKRDNFSGYHKVLQHHECIKRLVRDQVLAAFSDTKPRASDEAGRS